MKIKVVPKTYDEVRAIPAMPHKDPLRPSAVLRRLVPALSAGELRRVFFHVTDDLPADLAPDEPCLILMNHSSFIDLKIAFTVFRRRPFQIICTSDGFVGKEGLMRHLGCIPTQKFVPDMNLVRDMRCCLKQLRTSVLMFPEASYSFDGTATPLPESLGKCLKVLGVPVIFVKTAGAFARDPLYNNLQLRQVPVSARISLLFTAEETAALPVPQINARLKEAFTFDNWQWQRDNHIRVTEPFRADYLHRVCFRCPVCGSEAGMEGRGVTLTCRQCGAVWELSEEGALEPVSDSAKALAGRQPAPDDDTDPAAYDLTRVPAWYAWERACVRREIETGAYRLELPVTIRILADTKAIYEVGGGVLLHDAEGFRLTGCDGALDYRQSPAASYSLYADYYWYELGDMICIGDAARLYYCFPQAGENVAARARLAAEEMYKMRRK